MRLELLEAERFYQIIIRPGIQPANDILGGSQGGQHDHGGMVTEPLPVLFAKLQAVHLRHYNIQNQQLEIVLLCQFPTGGTVVSDIYLMPELPQAPFYERGDVYLVFY